MGKDLDAPSITHAREQTKKSLILHQRAKTGALQPAEITGQLSWVHVGTTDTEEIIWLVPSHFGSIFTET